MNIIIIILLFFKLFSLMRASFTQLRKNHFIHSSFFQRCFLQFPLFSCLPNTNRVQILNQSDKTSKGSAPNRSKPDIQTRKREKIEIKLTEKIGVFKSLSTNKKDFEGSLSHFWKRKGTDPQEIETKRTMMMESDRCLSLFSGNLLRGM